MLQDRFTLLVTRKLTGEITTAEEQELDVLLAEPGNAEKFHWIKRFWDQKEFDGRPNVEHALNKVMAGIQQEEITEPEVVYELPEYRKPNRWKPILVLASLVVIIGSIYYFTTIKSNSIATVDLTAETIPAANGSLVEKHNTKGTRSLITLADGSKVWLNADSKLSYPAAFNGDTREVELAGEAFFDVAKNKSKPFIIHLKKGTVRVLGTSFNIKAYDGSRVVETSVVTGRVAFIPHTSNATKTDTTFLTHNMKAVYTIETGLLTTATAISDEDKAWTEGKLIFKDISLKDIAETLERNFGKEVLFNSEQIMEYKLTGSFENDSLEEILYYLARSKPFIYKITETQVLLSAVE